MSLLGSLLSRNKLIFKYKRSFTMLLIFWSFSQGCRHLMIFNCLQYCFALLCALDLLLQKIEFTVSKRLALDYLLLFMAFFKVVVICACPTTVEKFCGLYFLAETINLSIAANFGKLFLKNEFVFTVLRVTYDWKDC